MLFEECLSSSPMFWNESSGDIETSTAQRMLPPNEPIMDAVACWNGSTRRFQLRKKSSDPSGRAWISSIIKGAGASTSNLSNAQSTSAASSSSSPRRADDWIGLPTRARSPTSPIPMHGHGRSFDIEPESSGDFLEVTSNFLQE